MVCKRCIHAIKSYKGKYGHPGKSIKSIFTKKNIYTLHYWRDLVTKKYKLETDGDYHEDSLWEKIKLYVDTL